MRSYIFIAAISAVIGLATEGFSDDRSGLAGVVMPMPPNYAYESYEDEKTAVNIIVEMKRLLNDAGRSAAREYLSQQLLIHADSNFKVDRRLSFYEASQLKDNCNALGARCVIGPNGSGSRQLPPFPVVSPSQLLKDGPGCGIEGKEFVLAPSAEVPSFTPGILADWVKKADEGTVFDCEKGYCVSLVRTDSSNSEMEAGWEGLAACLVATVGETVGAPAYCENLYLAKGRHVYVQAISGTDILLCSLGRPDFQFLIDVGQNRIQDLLLRVQAALVSTPLELTTEIFPDYVLGISDTRPSPVLSGYRERVTVRVDVESLPLREVIRLGSDSDNGIGAIISTDLLLNRQNTDQPSDWHPPTNTQSEQYVTSVKTSLKDQLSLLCQHSVWRDDKTMMCTQTTPSP